MPVRESQLADYDSRIFKKILHLTVKNAEVRDLLSSDEAVWSDLSEVMNYAHASLAARSVQPDKQAADYDTDIFKIVVTNHASLTNDLPRVRDQLLIIRNLLACGQYAQTLASSRHINTVVIKMIELSQRVAGRGPSSEATADDEENWESVALLCKFVCFHPLATSNDSQIKRS